MLTALRHTRPSASSTVHCRRSRCVCFRRSRLVVKATGRSSLAPWARRPVVGPSSNGTNNGQTSTESADPSTSYSVLESFYYGRAFAVALNRRVSELVVDVISDISRLAAERPQRIRDFQEEVAMLARQAMGLPELSINNASSSSRSYSMNNGAPKSTGIRTGAESQDLQAVVDDIRAEAAYARSILQQIKIKNAARAVV